MDVWNAHEHHRYGRWKQLSERYSTFNFANITTDPVTPSPEQSVHVRLVRGIAMQLQPFPFLHSDSHRTAPSKGDRGFRADNAPRSKTSGWAIASTGTTYFANVNGTRAPCLVVDARTSYGRIAYVYMTTDVVFNGASTSKRYWSRQFATRCYGSRGGVALLKLHGN
jgi:hypothetical protein